MLVLTRREQQTILIGDDIEVTIVRTGEATRVGITAPKNVKILRKELKGPQSDAKTIVNS